ncbi:hypothetical protein V6N11_063092 [Hibiscus sabdariffa]|uniref:rRNA methyltransferase n=1 Tax=Hibiscus sabdariffa TaxID=183260 RepID=A0ABR2AFJ1_9ROSI
MGKVKGKRRKDEFYRLAKECGYRSRASWKLVELNSRFSFLDSAHAVLDLCAAPGSWMQVTVQHAPVGSLVLGLDLVPIAPIREHRVMAFDVVLNDGSPNVGGAYSQEAMCQNALVIDSVKLATQFLAPKGTFVTKVFRSQDYSSILYCLKQLFEKVEVCKPRASRLASAEIYVLGLRYKAPAEIDPRLLDFEHLFQGSVEPQKKVIDVLRVTKQKRHRDGYEDGETISKKMSTAADFICFVAYQGSQFYDRRGKALCDDLRVLGKQEFKHLLKWRMQLRKHLPPPEKATPPPTPTTANDEDYLLNEMEELTYAMERKKRRKKKLLAKRRAKDKSRKATGMQIGALEDGYVDHELFSLSSIKGKKDLAAVDSNEYDDGDVDLRGGEDEQIREESTEDESSSDIDSDEERRRYDEKIEEILDHAYEEYVSKKDGSTKQRKRAKEAYEKLEGGDDDIVLSDHDSDMEEADPEANPLMVPLDDGEGPTQEEITNRWFGQGIFADAIEQGDLGKYDSDDEMETDKREERPAIPERSKVKKKQDEKTDIPNKAEEKKANNAAGPRSTKLQASKAEDDFEIVPAPATDSSDDSSSDDSEEDGVETKAEILACAKKMLRKKQRDQTLDDAYNKFMFHDDGLPKWFLDEEKRHCQPIKPVTKEEIAAMRAEFKEINARPAKKVAQAKARKKRIAMKKLDKVCQKANSISDQADITEWSKWKQIEQLYKKAMPKKAQKEYVVAKKGVRVRAGKGKVLVDRRMKKDARARRTGKSGKARTEKLGKCSPCSRCDGLGKLIGWCTSTSLLGFSFPMMGHHRVRPNRSVSTFSTPLGAAEKSVPMGTRKVSRHQRTWPLAERWWFELQYTMDSARHDGKGGSDRGSGCIVNLWTGKAAMLRTLRPGLSSIHIDICYGYNTSLEPEPLEATLVHIISQDGAGLRCGLSVYLTRLGSYKTDRDRGCNVKLPRSRNCESDRDRGCIVVLS